jgi:haloalkane dehalogenase
VPDLPNTPADVLALLAAGPTRRISVGPVDVATWTIGSGPELVLLHGWPLHAATFRAHVPTLARSFTCRLIDLPGAGQTRCAPGAAGGLPGYAKVARQVIDELGLGAYGLLAHDSGGAVARMVAADDPERVRALVIAGTEIPGHRPWQLQAFLAAVRLPGGIPAFQTALRSRWIRRSALGFGGCFTDPAFVDGEFFDLFVGPLLNSPDVVAGQTALLKHFTWPVIDGLAAVHGRIKAPTCLIWGDRDAFFPVDKARAMAAQFAGPSEFHAIPGGRLFVHEDHPETFLAFAEPFLRRHLDAAR